MRYANAFELAAQQQDVAARIEADARKAAADAAAAEHLRTAARFRRAQANARNFERQLVDRDFRDQVREHRRLAAALEWEARELER